MGNPKLTVRIFIFLSVSPQLRHRFAKELWTTLHFLHSFDIFEKIDFSPKKSTNTIVYFNFCSKIKTYESVHLYTANLWKFFNLSPKRFYKKGSLIGSTGRKKLLETQYPRGYWSDIGIFCANLNFYHLFISKLFQ